AGLRVTSLETGGAYRVMDLPRGLLLGLRGCVRGVGGLCTHPAAARRLHLAASRSVGSGTAGPPRASWVRTDGG
ncbi:hypothetical protein, partial [Streptomyces sp. NPDC048551]|uniref:hypothetical protein n=1 Tax=Streptomyces sp. NPDC048551 TaxID=3155758 RepID=UPI0034433A14